MSYRNSMSIMIFLYIFLLGFTPFSLAQLEPPRHVAVEGYVLDRNSRQPLSGAVVLAYGWREGVFMRTQTHTGIDGYYRMSLPVGVDYYIGSVFDNPYTPGFDYVPGYVTLSTRGARGGEVFNISFYLVPGASIMLKGDVLIVESPEPLTWIIFDVIDASTGERLQLEGSLTFYSPWMASQIGLDPRNVPVPAGMLIGLEVTGYLWRMGTGESYRFIIDNEGSYFNLAQGQLVEVDLRRYSLKRNIDVVREKLGSVESMISEAEYLGLYLSAQRGDLSRARRLLTIAEAYWERGFYDHVFPELREAYLILSGLKTSLKQMYSDATTTAFASIPLIAFASMILAFLLFEGNYLKAASTFLFYSLLLGVFSFVYPGFELTELNSLATVNLASLLFIFFLMFPPGPIIEAVGRVAGVKYGIAMIFSLAKRSLRRRKLRLSLALISMIILVFSFTSLTSFSISQGVVFMAKRIQPPSEGLLIRKLSEGFAMPLDPLVIEWLRRKPEVALVAPKAENIPQIYPISNLTSQANRSIPIYGVLGIIPSLEPRFTYIDGSISLGSYLGDDDDNAILISEEASKLLGVGVYEAVRLFERDFIVIGLFKDEIFNKLKDIDGETLKPLKRTLADPLPVPCESYEFVVMTFKAALSLPRTMLSRVNVRLNPSQDPLSFARRIVLEREYWVFASVEGRVYEVFLGGYVEIKGFAYILVPLVMVALNVGFMMLNVVYERRKEVAILSMLGLNPTYVTGVFIAEATIIGLIGGLLGYLLGLGSYRFLYLLPTPIMLQAKVSINWSIAAVVIAILTAIMASALPALRATKIATPSLPLKWEMRASEVRDGLWLLKMPVSIKYSHIEPFLSYVEGRLKQLTGVYEKVEGLRRHDEHTLEALIKKLSFKYIYGEGERSMASDNELIVKIDLSSKLCDVSLLCKPILIGNWPPERTIRKSASLIRQLTLEWSSLPKGK